MELTLRKSYRGQLTKLVNSVNGIITDENVSLDDVAVLIQRIQAVNLTLKDLNSHVASSLKEDQYESECEKIVEYDVAATEAIARLERKLTTETQLRSELQQGTYDAQNELSGNVGNNQNNMQNISVRLPKLDIIKFNGEIALWPEFWEQYSAAIHDNKSLDNTAKFAYLKSYLVGKAAVTISGLTSGQSSYEDAIDLLKAEYACTERIIDKYVQKLFLISHIKNERDTVGLRKLFTTVSTITKSLTTLGISADQYGLLVKSVVFQALPYNMRVAYNKQKISDTNDNASVSGQSKASAFGGDKDYESQINRLLQFLKVELDSIEQANCSNDFEAKENDNKRFNRSWNNGRNKESFTAAGLLTGAKECCLFCHSKSHVTINCDCSLSVTAKKDILKKNRLCFRCAKPNHNSKFCKTRDICCAKCKRRHATTMCEPQNVHTGNSSEPRSGVASANNNTNNSSTALLANGITNNIYLKTACAFISSKNSNEEALIRMIVDGGSQLTFIREDISRRMALPVIGTHKIAIQSFGQSEMAPARLCNCVKLELKSQYDNNVLEISAVEVPEICFDNLKPPSHANPIIKQFSVNNRLADFVVGPQQPILGFSLLIGADNYWRIVSNETTNLTNTLTAVNTKFGWTIHGASDTNVNEINDYIVNFNSSIVLHAQVEFSDQTELNLRRFWDLETIGINASDITVENSFTSDFIKNNVTFDNDRYQVTLPWQNDKILDSNFSGALVRGKRLVNKLCKNGTLTEYDNAIRDYVRSGCAEKVPDNENNTMEQAYYMPHRPIYRNDKDTTKLRVVFDASAHAPGTPSLNEKLLSGQNLLPNLMKILINFRIGAVAVIADIEKAFLQIGLHKEDRDYHRFLWFKEAVKENITSTTELPDFTTFRMTRVTFGVTTSPFLLAATLRKHLMESPEREIATTLLKSFYVDDLVLAVGSKAEALKLYEKANSIMSKANMNLRKWCSNDPTMMQRINEEEKKSPTKLTSNKKVLGVIWRPITDELTINLSSIFETDSSTAITKRNVLQTIAKIFDPIGILGPYVVRAKIILQNIWKRNSDWDDILPEDLSKEWIKWREELLLLNDYSIDRCLVKGPTDEVELHIFSDASPQAYGCVAYLKNLMTGGCKFIMSKNRVSPLDEKKDKALTLPKLELTAALCAARLQKYLLENLSLNVKDVVIWSDSKIALYWIKGKAMKWKPYVQNRVVEIRNLQGDTRWRHCPGKDNPADLLTRGVSSANYLIESKEWLEGPSWLQEERDNWPENEFTGDKEIDAVTCFIEVQEDSALKMNPMFCFDKFSNLDKVLRITAYARRFLNNIDKRRKKITGPLTVSEISKAETYWIQVIQHEAFSKEISELMKEKPLSSQSTILLLRPFLDEKKVLRLGGRLQEACLSQEEKHPVILPKNSSLTTRIIWKAHDATFHSGVNATLAETRKRFWIIKGRQKIKSVTSSCVKCKRLKGKPGNEPFAPLPKDRLISTHPFEVTGIDFAGPLYIASEREQRVKVYVMLFTCAVVRAVHLELVPNLTTENCIRGLRRFIARRGVPRIIYSDNAKTFKRASEELHQLANLLTNAEVQELAHRHRIEWKFIVERAAWWGGFWGRLVRTVKDGLKFSLGKKILGFDELQTILSEVEMTVNSRPLTYIDNDPTNLMILSPAKFLIGTKDMGFSLDVKLPEIKRSDILKQWRARESLVSRFWRKWTQDYIQQLRSAHYVKNPKSTNFKVGDVLLLHDQNRPRLTWKLVRVTACFQGRDGRTRACEVKTSNGTCLRRPIQLLYPLEIEQFPPGEDVENSV